MNHKQKRKLVVTMGKIIGNTLLLMIIFGYEPYTIVSGSMEPAVPTGSLVYIRRIEAEAVEIGDVIAYYGDRDENAVIVHRVVERDERSFITKGDANETEDLRPVGYDQLMGIVSISVPHLGIFAEALTMGNGRILTVSLVFLALVLHLLAITLERKKEK